MGLIVPLTGSHAAIGQRMRDAARLALPEGQEPPLDVFDSAQPEGPAQAARMALAAGDRIVLGPLMAGDTRAVASVLQPAGVPELAFTSDVTQARPGVWVLGLTPEQQVRRLVDAARLEGRKRFAAFLPDTALGHSMGEGLVLACQEAGLEVPQVVFHGSDVGDITQKLAELTRRPAQNPGPVAPSASSDAVSSIAGVSPASPKPEAGPSAADPLAEGEEVGASSQANGDSATPSRTENQAAPDQAAGGLNATSTNPPPFDALLLGDTGLDLAHVIETLKSSQLLTPQVRILGPMLWRAFDGKLGDLHGAWYVAFDEMQRSGYVQSYQNAYHQMPSPVADFAYDSAALAGALIRQGKLNVETLTQPKGYIGVDGLFHLRADGRMMRALGVYQIVPGGGSQLIIPASRDLTAPSSLVTGSSPVSGQSQGDGVSSPAVESQALPASPVH